MVRNHELDDIQPPPVYQPLNQFYTVVFKKTELETPFSRASSSPWKPVVINLDSTSINFYSLRPEFALFIENLFRPAGLSSEIFKKTNLSSESLAHSDFENDHGSKHKPEKKVEESHKVKRQPLLAKLMSLTHHKNLDPLVSSLLVKLVFGKPEDNSLEHEFESILGPIESSYSLQCCKIGKASDFKRGFALRMRLEVHQCLCQFANLSLIVSWYHHISSSIQSAMPIDQRYIEKGRTLPRAPLPGNLNDVASDTVLVSDMSNEIGPLIGIGFDNEYSQPLQHDTSTNDPHSVWFDRNRIYPISIIESVEFYSRNLRDISYLRPDVAQFHQICEEAYGEFIQHNSNSNDGAESLMSCDNSVNVKNETSPTVPTHVKTPKALTASFPNYSQYGFFPLEYQCINEIELYNLFYGYSCINSLRRRDIWENCFVVVSGFKEKEPHEPKLNKKFKTSRNSFDSRRSSTGRHRMSISRRKSFADGLAMSPESRGKKILKYFTKSPESAAPEYKPILRRLPTLKTNFGSNESLPLSEDLSLQQKIDPSQDVVKLLKKFDVELFSSPFLTSVNRSKLSVANVASADDYLALEQINSQFLNVVLSSNESKRLKKLTCQDVLQSRNFSYLIYIKASSVDKFLKGLRSGKLSILNAGYDSAFCKRLMILSSGLVGWL